MPFQWDFVAAFVFASASFMALIWLSDSRHPWLAVSLSALAAFLSECCLASGLLVWPILVLTSLTLRFTRRQKSVLAAVGAIGLFLYLKNYHQPAYHSHPLESLRQPWLVIAYVLNYFGNEFSTYCTFPNTASIFFMLAGFSALSFLVWNPGTRPVAKLLLTNTVFLVGTAFMTALGRINFGIDQAASSRYQTPAMLFWACMFASLFLVAWEFRSWRDLMTLNVIALVLILIPLPLMKPFTGGLKDRAGHMNLLAESLDQGVIDPVVQTPEALANLTLPLALQVAAYLHQLGLTAGPPQPVIPVNLLAAASPKHSWCKGEIDEIASVKRASPGPHEVRIMGWAMTSQTESSVPVIAVADQEGRVLASSRIHLYRGDVVAVDPRAEGFIGWELYVPLRDRAETLNVFAIMDGRSCKVGTAPVPVE